MIFKNIRKQYKLQKSVEPFKRHTEDVSSPAVQIARLTATINDLSKHLIEHKKDLHSLMGLKKMSSKRKKLLKYLGKKNKEEYTNIITTLTLRHSLV